MKKMARPPKSLPPHMERDGPCGESIDPALDNLCMRAHQAGWLDEEIVAAVVTWATHRAVDIGGARSAADLLMRALELVAIRDSHEQGFAKRGEKLGEGI